MLTLFGTRLIQGYFDDFKEPVLIAGVKLHRAQISRAALLRLDTNLRRALPDYERCEPAHTSTQHPILGRLVTITLLALRAAGVPAFNDGRIVVAKTGQESTFNLALPSLAGAQAETERLLTWAVSLFNECLEKGEEISSRSQIDKTLSELPEILKQIARVAPRGMNSLRFIQAASDRKIPWRRVYGNVYQFGWGTRARWLDSSFTDATPAIGAKLARDKRAAAIVLRSAGLPVPAHAQASDIAHALQIAEALGYPVVVKPADLDGGKGVSAGLRNPDAVRKAFEKARKVSQAVLVERHFEGNDYRLQVLHGKVFWISHRVPGSVVGDGLQSVTQLLAQLNANPSRGPVGSPKLLRWITLDDEALELLSEQELDPDSIPEAGRFVRLRRTANVATGGTPVPTLDIAHPDNLELGIRAAAALRLDLAGVDLLIPDIRQSWLETGAAICEVNAQPQMSPGLPAQVLEQLVNGNGRIPVVVVFGPISTPDCAAWFEALQTTLETDSAGGRRCLALATPTRACIDRRQVLESPCGAYLAGTALLADSRVEVLLMQMESDEWVQTGLPIDQFDALILTESTPTTETPQNARMRRLEQLLQRRCQGPIITGPKDFSASSIQTIQTALSKHSA